MVMAALRPLADKAFEAARKQGRRERPEAYAWDALVELVSSGGGGSSGDSGRGGGGRAPGRGHVGRLQRFVAATPSTARYATYPALALPPSKQSAT